METRASHILVGSFVLTFLAGLIGFAVWIAKVDLDAEYADYDIFFNDTVSGLYKRSIVFYSGIPVGDVRDITLAPNDPSKVRVWVRLNADMPVNTETVARLEFQGLTGVAYIELQGGAKGAAKIKRQPGQERPVIPSEASAFQAVYENAPNLINDAIAAILQVQKLISDENIGRISRSLENAEKVTANLAEGTENLDSLVAETRDLLAKVSDASSKIAALAETGNSLLADDGARLVGEATATMVSAKKLLDRLDTLVAANEDNVTQFVGGSLPEVSRMIVDLRAAAQSLSRLMARIEQNPAEVILGGKESQYDLKTRTVSGEEK